MKRLKITINLSSEFLAKHGAYLPTYDITRVNANQFSGFLHKWRSLASDVRNSRFERLVEESVERGEWVETPDF